MKNVVIVVAFGVFLSTGCLAADQDISVNFSTVAGGIQSYGGGQDGMSTATVEDGGAILHLVGNGWKKIALDYTFTPNTILEFDYRSDAEGEIHGIGFDDDNIISQTTTYQLDGIQTWGIQDSNDYPAGADSGGWKHYVITVGLNFTGNPGFMTFVMDHDVVSPTGESFFRNVKVYEPVNPSVDGPQVNFNTVAGGIQSYGGGQDRMSTVTVEDSGATLHLVGNGWKKIALDYTFTPNTILEFDYKSDAEGEIHGIGFDDNNTINQTTVYQLDGRQSWGMQDNNGYPDGADVNGWKHYVIAAGLNFSGNPGFMTFVMDHDIALPTGESYFRNVKIYEPVDPPIDGPVSAHNTITAYNGPATCIGCHQTEATEMLQSLHMTWSGPTPDLTNTNGEALGKGIGGINTFCTYAMSSKSACFSCHVRADGNAPDEVKAVDVDCLMCHSDTYQRKFLGDPDNTETVENINGETKTYKFGKVDVEGNYTTVPDYDKMPPGTNMVNVARTVHMPTNQSCLRCHAKAGGGDWTKRGDMGLSSVNPPVQEDVHLSKDGAGLSCVSCHSALNHKISGRGIDLRQTEAEAPTCKSCHTTAPHSSSTLNRHAQGQVSCQVCHIREFGKGGATEMSRDWENPVWNQAFCSGQGGFVGHEVKESNVKPEYVWFDGTSYVYNVGETIEPDHRGVLAMAKANGAPFDGNSYIVPIKRHFSNIPLDDDGKIIPPAIMWMFMTGDFDLAVQKGIEEQAEQGIQYSGNYNMVRADAEMLITHGVEPKENAPSCNECHDESGATPDGTGMLPFNALGYHEVPDAVRSCTLCHESENDDWDDMHQSHRQDDISCASCHTTEPTGLVKAENVLCSSCHENKSWKGDEGHKKHVKKRVECVSCHTF